MAPSASAFCCRQTRRVSFMRSSAEWGGRTRRPGLRVRPPHSAELRMKLTLRVWRQQNAEAEGAMSTYEVDGISSDMSFLEMLDLLNEQLILSGQEPVAFDHDCREGIC